MEGLAKVVVWAGLALLVGGAFIIPLLAAVTGVEIGTWFLIAVAIVGVMLIWVSGAAAWEAWKNRS